MIRTKEKSQTIKKYRVNRHCRVYRGNMFHTHETVFQVQRKWWIFWITVDEYTGLAAEWLANDRVKALKSQ